MRRLTRWCVRMSLAGVVVALAASCKSVATAAMFVPQHVTSISPLANLPTLPSIRGSATGNWGIALSGGGIRSATFGIGVMKALYDLGYMDSVAVISSVSGGGYASYWLFRRELASADAAHRFGESVFSNSRFDKSVCELQALGNFQTFGQMIGAAVDPGSFEKYRFAIRRSFGLDASLTDPEPRLDATMDNVQRGTMPLFILNATLDAPDRGKFPNVVEISPGFIGSPSLGYHVWTRDDSLPAWSESVAVSGAAVQTLKHVLRNYPSAGPASTLRLWDGGEAENLGALSLIRRRVKNIVIVDGEHDPSYGFAGYFILKKLLPAEGFQISVPAIDDFIEKRSGTQVPFDGDAVSEGIVVSSSRDGAKADTSRILYVKLARTKSVEMALDTSGTAYIGGKRYQARIDALMKSAGSKLDRFRRCAVLAGHEDGFRAETVVYNVANFAKLMDRIVADNVRGRGPSVLRFEFPQTTTVDQSYFPDQTRAFIGLGYLVGMQIGKPVFPPHRARLELSLPSRSHDAQSGIRILPAAGVAADNPTERSISAETARN